jgi:CBS domain-containing protein
VSFDLQLDTETVDQTHPPRPLCVEPERSVRDILQLLRNEETESVLVCRAGVLVGIFTERDALRLTASDAELDVPVEQVMSAKPECISNRETVGAAISKMAEGGFRHLPIIDDEGHPVGLLKVSLILHYLVQHFPKYIYNLPPKPHQATRQREGA